MGPCSPNERVCELNRVPGSEMEPCVRAQRNACET